MASLKKSQKNGLAKTSHLNKKDLLLIVRATSKVKGSGSFFYYSEKKLRKRFIFWYIQ